jgi:hypothetical protein
MGALAREREFGDRKFTLVELQVVNAMAGTREVRGRIVVCIPRARAKPNWNTAFT